MFCSSSNQFLGSAVIPVSVLQEALTLHLLRTLGKMSTIPLFSNLSMHSGALCTLKELKEWPPSLKNIRAFLLFSCWSNYPVQSTLNYDGAKCQNNALPTQIKQLLIHLQRMYVSIKINTKKLKWFLARLPPSIMFHCSCLSYLKICWAPLQFKTLWS